MNSLETHTVSIEMLVFFAALATALYVFMKPRLPSGGTKIMLYIFGPVATLYLAANALMFLSGH